ncbi:type VI secretion system baseplate subunit TssF [Photorhabdus tasmaniensis]|uniref:Type VI secretion system baseplate subunit TssF n=1 Tax=Photorhabdus tasmaniensis TaxID=1004159 RepID=A0ABX0GLF9_9GAMM|nr:type VI secretion system baseplate subunit TssF [Photorhabdus tasmaniensis]NHB89686.1 type VI secretion system baseplate subunit TssF [Photorhabdus tasmaniensis]
MILLPQKILTYYNRELSYLRQYGAAFSQHFPKIAKRLGFAEGVSEDPHVERLVESFAFLTAKIHQRIDEDMPELNNAMLEVLVPQFLRQIPSVSLVQFQQDPLASGVTGVMTVARHTPLISQPVGDVACSFRTVYPLEMLPLDLTHAELMPDPYDRDFILTLNVTLWPGASFQARHIRLYLHGTPILAHSLYELLSAQVKQLECRLGERVFSMDSRNIQVVGFDPQDNLCVDDLMINPTHHLFRDYFSFPERFLFLDIPLPDAGLITKSAGELHYRFRLKDCAALRRIERMSDKVDSETFRLNCVPVVNLFSHQAEPIIPLETEHEYLVQPDARRPQSMEVYTIDRVEIVSRQQEQLSSRSIPSLFGIEHAQDGEQPLLFWQASPRRSLRHNETGMNMFIGFSDSSGEQLKPETDVVVLNLTCTNRDMPRLLSNGHPDGDFESEVALPGVKILGLIRPRFPVRPQPNCALNWRLVSQLNLNQMLLSGSQGVQCLKETLELYNLHSDPAISQLIAQLQQIAVVPVSARLNPADPYSLARGLEVTLTFQTPAGEFVDFYLFCSLLERFIAMYAPINSFTQTVTQLESVNNSMRRWPRRSGRLTWL